MPVSTYATAVEADRVVFRLPDPDGLLTGVRLWSEVPVDGSAFERTDDGWQLDAPRPAAHRVEYLFEVTDGEDRLSVPDPTNPLRVPGVFGDHSWLPMPGYTEPAWLDAQAIDSTVRPWSAETADGELAGALWTPADPPDSTPLPLLICHDGTQMNRYGRLTDFIGTAIASDTIPPLRVLLLDPGADRNARYAANPAYSKALVNDVIPAIDARVANAGKPVVMGQSLGAVAALHAARRYPGAFAGLFLQSGSFFTPQHDPQETGYSHWRQVTGFVSTLYRSPAPERVPTMIVCGTAEENLANNRALATHLAQTGGDIGWGDVADGHTWTTWRDLLDPHLTRLLQEAWH